MPIDHVGVNASDFEGSKRFYEAALRPLGYRLLAEFGGQAAGFGPEGGHADFWVGTEPAHGSSHIAFTAADRASVDAFHEAAIGAGGKDNGRPGVRAHYHENYYAAYVHDPDGNNVEAVCHTPASA